MPRLKEAGREAANDYATQIFNIVFGDRDPVAEPGTATGTPGNWWTVFNIVPEAFGFYLLFRALLALLTSGAGEVGKSPISLFTRRKSS